jgi:hypothetical protein
VVSTGTSAIFSGSVAWRRWWSSWPAPALRDLGREEKHGDDGFDDGPVFPSPTWWVFRQVA